jgi:glycosyltransferase involved in cell wall biosynthesis
VALAVRQAVATMVVSSRERDAVERIVPGARVAVVGNGIDLDAFRRTTPPAAEPTVIFCGVMSYQPNDEGVRWFAAEIWPRVRQARPDATFVVVGPDPSAALRAIAAADSSIELLGRVPEVQPHLWRSAVAVAPLRLARGLQNKVLEALAAGLPVVVTSAVFEGLPDAARPGCVLADAAGDFAGGVVALLDASPADRLTKSNAARLADLKWEQTLRPVQGIISPTPASIQTD